MTKLEWYIRMVGWNLGAVVIGFSLAPLIISGIWAPIVGIPLAFSISMTGLYLTHLKIKKVGWKF